MSQPSSARRPSTRWTGAAGAFFASNLVRRRLGGDAPPGQLRRWAAMTSEAREAQTKRSGFGWLVGVYFGLGLRPFTFLLTYLFSGPVAFGVAIFIMNLVAYPFFLRNSPRLRWVRNWGFWHFAVYGLIVGIIGFFLSRAYFPNP